VQSFNFKWSQAPSAVSADPWPERGAISTNHGLSVFCLVQGNKELSLPELKAIFNTRKAVFAAKLDTNTSYKMSALNRWTVSLCNAMHSFTNP